MFVRMGMCPGLGRIGPFIREGKGVVRGRDGSLLGLMYAT